MANPSEKVRLVLIGDPGPTQQQITNAISNQNDFEFVDTIMSLERLVREVSLQEPDLILIDRVVGGQVTLDVIDDLAQQFPHAAVVAILPDQDPVAIQQVLLAGARGFIIQPFTQVNLLSTLRRVFELESRRMRVQKVAAGAEAVESERPVETIAVYSPRGGVGTSTVAVNLAIALSETTHGRVLLMEGKMFFGHQDILLNIRQRNNIVDLLPHASSLDDGLIMDVVSEHATGIYVLLGPNDLQVAQGIRADDLYSVFISLQRLFDYIVIDVGSYLNDNSVTLMDAADKILLLTTPDLAALHDTSTFVQISRSLAYPADKIMLVLNRKGMPGGVTTKDIEAVLHQQVYAEIPDDSARALRSINRGVPLLIRYPRSPSSRAITSLAKSVLDMKSLKHSALPEMQSGGGSQREVLLASSRLG